MKKCPNCSLFLSKEPFFDKKHIYIVERLVCKRCGYTEGGYENNINSVLK